jgi:hypothetical protein
MSAVGDVAGRLMLSRKRRQVSISRDDGDFVVRFQPENIVVFRHDKAIELRRICLKLRWEIVSDTVPDPTDQASW